MADDAKKSTSSTKMAEEEEILERLKRERAGAQSAFTRKANILIRTAKSSPEGKLKAEWEKFEGEYCNVIAANTDYIEALCEANTEVSRQQAEDVKRMADDCDQKFVEVEDNIKSSLWSRFAEPELAPLARRAENAMDRAEEIDVERITLELSAVQSKYLRESIEKTRINWPNGSLGFLQPMQRSSKSMW